MDNNETVFEEESVEEILSNSDLDPKVEKAKAIATLLIVCIVNVLNICGYAVDAGPLLNVIGSVASAVSILYAWWKNQNVTEAAVAGQSVLNFLKDKDAANGKHAAKAA